MRLSPSPTVQTVSDEIHTRFPKWFQPFPHDSKNIVCDVQTIKMVVLNMIIPIANGLNRWLWG